MKTKEEARVESAVFLGLVSALLPWIVVNLAGLLDALNKSGAFASASAVIVTLLFFHALCSFLWAFGLRLSHPQLKLLGKIVLVIDGGMALISLCYTYLLFVVMIGLIADRNFPAVWIVAGMNIVFFAILIALRKLIRERIQQWFRIDVPGSDSFKSQNPSH